MLVILIPAAWLAIVAFVVMLCRGAARADVLAATVPAELSPAAGRQTLSVFDARQSRKPLDGRLRERPLRASGGRAGVPLARARGGRCAAGS